MIKAFRCYLEIAIMKLAIVNIIPRLIWKKSLFLNY